MRVRGFVNSLSPSSYDLWREEKRWHWEYCRRVWEHGRAGEERQWEALREMARCRDELNRRGVTHL